MANPTDSPILNPNHVRCRGLVNGETMASTMDQSMTHTMVNRGVSHEFIHELAMNYAIGRFMAGVRGMFHS